MAAVWCPRIGGAAPPASLHQERLARSHKGARAWCQRRDRGRPAQELAGPGRVEAYARHVAWSGRTVDPLAPVLGQNICANDGDQAREDEQPVADLPDHHSQQTGRRKQKDERLPPGGEQQAPDRLALHRPKLIGPVRDQPCGGFGFR